MPDKSHVIIIIINTRGQIVQIYFITKDCLTCCGLQISLYFAVWPAKRSVLLSTVCHLAASSDNNGN